MFRWYHACFQAGVPYVLMYIYTVVLVLDRFSHSPNASALSKLSVSGSECPTHPEHLWKCSQMTGVRSIRLCSPESLVDGYPGNRMFSPIHRANELANQSPVRTGLRDPLIFLLSCGLDHLIEGSQWGSLSQPYTSVLVTGR